MNRPDWDEYFLTIAEAVSARADCTRRRVGAVVVKDHRIVSTGYNGAPAGEPGCLSAGACPRGRHYRVMCEESHALGYCGIEECACGSSWPCLDASTPGRDYGNCIALHAEANALLYANRADCLGATIYVNEPPCHDCSRLISGAGIIRVVHPF